MVKDTDFKFQKTLSLGQSGHDPLIFFQKVGVPRVTFPLYFWALIANCSNAVKVTDFKFDNHVLRDTPFKIFRKEGVSRDA